MSKTNDQSPLGTQPNFWRNRRNFSGGRLAAGFVLPTSPTKGQLNPSTLLTRFGFLGLATSLAGLQASKHAQRKAQSGNTQANLYGLVSVTSLSAGFNAAGLVASSVSAYRSATEAIPNPTWRNVANLLLAAGGATSYVFEARQQAQSVRQLRQFNEARGHSSIGL